MHFSCRCRSMIGFELKIVFENQKALELEIIYFVKMSLLVGFFRPKTDFYLDTFSLTL